MKADILDKAFDNLFQMSDRPLTKNDFMMWLGEVRKLEAEPIERPEWEKKLEEMGYDLGKIVDQRLANFIRTEIIEKICEEIKKEFYQELPARGEFADDVENVKARWLGGSK